MSEEAPTAEAPSPGDTSAEESAPERSPAEVAAATLAAVQLQPGAKRRVAGVALALCGGLTTACALVALLFLQQGRGDAALGVFLGHAAAQLVTCTWLVGAIATFDRSSHDFLQATLGMSPLRLVVLATVVGCGLWLSEPEPAALFFTLMATHVLGHGIEGFVMRRLRLERVAAAEGAGPSAAPHAPAGEPGAPA